jgi:hypothetical protein
MHTNDKQEVGPALAQLDALPEALGAVDALLADTGFGIIKHVLGFRQFLLRGLRVVQGEWALVCMGWNLKRLFALKGQKRG